MTYTIATTRGATSDRRRVATLEDANSVVYDTIGPLPDGLLIEVERGL